MPIVRLMLVCLVGRTVRRRRESSRWLLTKQHMIAGSRSGRPP